MKTLYDVQQLLKQYGIFVYMGNRLYEIEVMKLELSQLYQMGLQVMGSKLGRGLS